MVGWISSYEEALRELGVAEEDVAFPQEPKRGAAVLMTTYIHRMKASLTNWFTNILEVGSGCLPVSVVSVCTCVSAHVCERGCVGGGVVGRRREGGRGWERGGGRERERAYVILYNLP